MRSENAIPSPTRMTSRRDAALRGAAWLIALGVAGFAPAWLSTPLVALAGLAVVERLVRHRRRGRLDAALVGTAGSVIVVALLGLALNMFPAGLTRSSWLVGLAVTGLAALWLSSRKALPNSSFRGMLQQIPITSWVLAAAAVVVIAAAILFSARVARQVDTSPLQISASAVIGGHAAITVTSGTEMSGLSLRVVTSGATITAASGLHISPELTIQVPITVAEYTRSKVDLVDGTGVTLRELIIDTTLTPRSGS